jgi:hypothetical protein
MRYSGAEAELLLDKAGYWWMGLWLLLSGAIFAQRAYDLRGAPAREATPITNEPKTWPAAQPDQFFISPELQAESPQLAKAVMTCQRSSVSRHAVADAAPPLL